MSALPPRVTCLGGATVDRTYRAPAALRPGTSNPVTAAPETFGGVARNVAETLARLGVPVALVSGVGDDPAGRALVRHLKTVGVGVEALATLPGEATATYLAVLEPDGSLGLGLAAMEILDRLPGDLLAKSEPLLWNTSWAFADCNLPAPLLRDLVAREGLPRDVRLAVDAVSVAKAARLPSDLNGVDLLFLNRDEASALLAAPDLPAEALARTLLERGARAAVLTLGERGAIVAGPEGVTCLPACAARVVDVTGAGDALIAATLASLLEGAGLGDAVRRGLAAAALTLEHPGSVRPDLSRALLASADPATSAAERTAAPDRPSTAVKRTHPADLSLTPRRTPPMTLQSAPLDIHPEVADALSRGAPVVALESTIITHGMPHPRNLETARAVEAQVRAEGAVPATIAVIGGRIRVGLDAETLEGLGTARDVLKLSRADLPYAVASGRHGSTTVAATMICAHLAGIRVFATGGIGGVHRGVETTLDISADLDELARTPVTVVCAGPKAVLDLPRTLEYLETRGVPVVGFGTDRLPAFWSRDSGLPAPIRLDTPEEVAGLVRAKERLGLGGGVLVANPVPAAHEIPADEIAAHIEAALEQAGREGISAKAVTPFLLAHILGSTGGRSLETNVALIRSNAAVAARIARALVG